MSRITRSLVVTDIEMLVAWTSFWLSFSIGVECYFYRAFPIIGHFRSDSGNNIAGIPGTSLKVRDDQFESPPDEFLVGANQFAPPDFNEPLPLDQAGFIPADLIGASKKEFMVGAENPFQDYDESRKINTDIPLSNDQIKVEELSPGIQKDNSDGSQNKEPELKPVPLPTLDAIGGPSSAELTEKEGDLDQDLSEEEDYVDSPPPLSTGPKGFPRETKNLVFRCYMNNASMSLKDCMLRVIDIYNLQKLQKIMRITENEAFYYAQMKANWLEIVKSKEYRRK